jgi:peptidase E
MICWFRDGLTDAYGDPKPLGDGLGFINASACPHYDGDKRRRPAYHKAVEQGLPGGFAADDGAALHFRGTELLEVVSSRESACAYRVDRVEGQIQEVPLNVRYLGRRPHVAAESHASASA